LNQTENRYQKPQSNTEQDHRLSMKIGTAMKGLVDNEVLWSLWRGFI